MICVNIDGREVQGFRGQTILEIAHNHHIDIPTLCHDDRVETYGACGLCVVEVKGINNLVRACATEARDGMIISTCNERVTRSRRLTLELLLSDHSGDCRPPCLKACPAETDCQGYVGLIANGQYREAVALIKEKIPLPASIGLVCPHPCEQACRRQMVDEPLAIAALKSFAGLKDLEEEPYQPEIKEASGKKVAIIGAGPAGLTAAYFLAREGHQVTVYEAMPQPGGMLRYGIPEYRLPKDILDQEINLISELGVTFITNTRINQDISLDYLRSCYDAVFIGIGAWKSSRIRCQGEDSPGVLGGIDFLRMVALYQPVVIGQRVAVVGGGNTAMDAARTAVRLGAKEVRVLYRRTRAEMPAQDIEIREAEEEGVIFNFLVAPLEIINHQGRVNAIRLQKMQLGEPDDSGRRSPIPVAGAEEVIPVDTVIAAIGQQVDAQGFTGLELSRWCSVDVDPNSYMTSLEGVFAGGDAVTGPGIAVEAIDQGRKAALAIDAYLKGQTISPRVEFTVEFQVRPEDFLIREKISRVSLQHVDPEVRKKDFRPVSAAFNEQQAIREAFRCLECGCVEYFNCRLISYANQYQVNPQCLAGEKHNHPESSPDPFIIKDGSKCILCGLCVRICEEVMGITALGMVNRGFDTSIQPALGQPLQSSGCISCGQCAAVCPTGALTEQMPVAKSVPLVMKETETTCYGCGLGCQEIFSSCGGLVFKAVPGRNEILCSRGRFGWAEVNRERITSPMVRKNGDLIPVTWKEALDFIAGSVRNLESAHNNILTGVFISPDYTVEEAQVAAQVVRKRFRELVMATFTPDPSAGLLPVLERFSSNRLEEMLQCDVLVMLGSFNNNQVVLARVRQAVRNGSRLLVISGEETLVDDLAYIKVDAGKKAEKQVLENIEQVFSQAGLAGNDTCYDINLPCIDSSDLMEIAQIYTKAHHAMIVVDGFEITAATVQAAARLAVITGHNGTPRNGIVVVTPKANHRGIWQEGFIYSDDVIHQLASGDMEAVFVWGEDPVRDGIITADQLSKCKLIVVSASHLNATAAGADIILPGSMPIETTGTFIRTDGVKRQVQQVKTPPSGKENRVWLAELGTLLG
ncbi:NAD(P)-binding protein [Syntrophomonas erecta subsp. sporosyntropha]